MQVKGLKAMKTEFIKSFDVNLFPASERHDGVKELFVDPPIFTQSGQNNITNSIIIIKTH